MIILGLSGALGHDPSAAILVDGDIAAAVEEERLVRDKHAKGRMPVESARYCLRAAALKPREIDVVAIPFAPVSLRGAARWHYARRHWYAPDRALDALVNGNRRYRRYRDRVLALGAELGIDWDRTALVPVEHHLAHASSAYHLSGFDGKAAILGIDGKGEYATSFFGWGEGGRIHRMAELYDPDSIAGLYGALTEYLGFDMLDGEYKVMGMAPYGDATRIDLSPLVRWRARGVPEIDTRIVNTVGLRRYKDAGRAFYFSKRLVDWLGPRRRDDAADEPWVHVAAAVQKLYEDVCLALVDAHLGAVLADCRQLCFAGGGALNVKLNQRLVARPDVERLFVQPAAGDAGTALGAATYVAATRGERLARQRHAYLGPSFSTDQCIEVLEARPERPVWRRLDDVPDETADLLAAGNPVAWFQGRMEFGPRALGARSILGCPSVAGIADRINEQIKFRERWRPFCPSILDRVAPDMIGCRDGAPFMTIAFALAEHWKARVPEVVHVDGTARVQTVAREVNPRYYALLEALEARTGNAVVLNTSLNRRGEPIVCTPTDALHLFYGSNLEYLVLEDLLVTKRAVQ
jgi:carbamoyltransferase